MSDTFRGSKDASPEAASVTAKHMADAVSYLMRVATEAGLRSIAAKLANVRTSLLNMAARHSPETASANRDTKIDTPN